MNPTLYPNENGTRKPNVYQCVGGIEKLVCDHWKDAFPGKPEGLYPCCMAKVEKIYKDAYDPEQLSRWRLHETTSPRRRRRALVNEQRQYRNGDVPRRYAPTPTGGPGTLQTVLATAKLNQAILIVRGSGGAADAVADYVLSGATRDPKFAGEGLQKTLSEIAALQEASGNRVVRCDRVAAIGWQRSGGSDRVAIG